MCHMRAKILVQENWARTEKREEGGRGRGKGKGKGKGSTIFIYFHLILDLSSVTISEFPS